MTTAEKFEGKVIPPMHRNGTGAVNGEQFLKRLSENPPTLYIDGQRVEDPTTHPSTKNMCKSLAGLYDMQLDPELRERIEEIDHIRHRHLLGVSRG